MEIIIYLTRRPVLHNFKPIRRIELLRTGLFEQNQSYLPTPVWEGGDLYPIDDVNWDKYNDCVKNNIPFDWTTIDS